MISRVSGSSGIGHCVRPASRHAYEVEVKVEIPDTHDMDVRGWGMSSPFQRTEWDDCDLHPVISSASVNEMNE